MKFKKYWKIILSLAVVLLLAVVLISNIEITKPENNVVEGNVVVEENDISDKENDNGVTEEELQGSPFEESKQGEEAKENTQDEAKEEKKSEGNQSVNEADNTAQASSTQSASETYSEPRNAASTQVKAENNKEYYSFSIDCYTVLNNMGDLKKGKEGCLGNDGLIFQGKVEGHEGESVKELLLDLCKKNNIRVSYKGDYITGINNLMEKDCGKLSGWMYSVNGVYPMKSVEAYKIQKNDVIKFRYTCKNCGGDLK